MATKLILTIFCVTSTVLRGAFAALPLQHDIKNREGQIADLTSASKANLGLTGRPACPAVKIQQHSPQGKGIKHQKRALPPPISPARREQLSRGGAELLEELFKDASQVPQSQRNSHIPHSPPWTRRELPLEPSSILLYPLLGLAGTNERPLPEVETLDTSQWKRVEYIQDRDYWASERPQVRASFTSGCWRSSLTRTQEPTRASFILTYSFSQRVIGKHYHSQCNPAALLMSTVMERSISPWFTNTQAAGSTWPPNVGLPNPYRWPDIAFMEYASMRPKPWNRFTPNSPAWFYIPADAGSWDTVQVISHCLQAMGQAHLPFWPGVTFPIGSECHRLMLATSSSQQVANFLKEHKTALGPRTLVSVTVFASCSSDESSGTWIPSLLWAVSTSGSVGWVQEGIQGNRKFEDKGHIGNWPYPFKPKYPHWEN